MPAELLRVVMTDDVATMRFGFRYLGQALFGEMTIDLKGGPQRARQKAMDAEARARNIAQSHDPMHGDLE